MKLNRKNDIHKLILKIFYKYWGQNCWDRFFCDKNTFWENHCIWRTKINLHFISTEYYF